MERLTVSRQAQRLLKAALALVVLTGPIQAGILPVGRPEYDFVYERRLREDARRLDTFDIQVAPYVLTRFENAPGPFAAWMNSQPERLHLFGFAAEDFRAARQARRVNYESLRAGLTGEPFKRLAVYADFILDKELADDPHYTGKKWRGFAGDIDQAFVAYTAERITLIFGRFGQFWGPRESLVFSPKQKLDGLGYTVRWGRLSLSYRLGALDGLNPDEFDVTQFEPRYVAAHRIDWHFGNTLRAGLFETVVFGGPGRQIDLFYLNPLIFYHGAQLNSNVNDNTMVGFDFDLQPRSGLLIYGQMLVDDIQLDNKTQGDQEPDQLGFLIGGYLADVLPQTDLQVEYERISNWTFNQMLARNRYLFNGHPIGDVRGNDYDLATVRVIHWWRDLLQSSLKMSYYRQGEGRIDAPFTQPWTQVVGKYSEPFPTGVVERTATVSLGLKGFLTDFAFVDFETGVDWVRNRGHQRADNPTLPFVRLYVSLFGLSNLSLE